MKQKVIKSTPSLPDASLSFDEPLHVGQLNMPDWQAFEQTFKGIFGRQYYTNHGPLEAELERRLTDMLGVRHAVSMTNATTAIMLTLNALDITGEVIVPSFTFPGTVEPISWAGLKPVFCDVDSVSHTMTAELVKPLITEKTGAILGVHLWGRSSDLYALERLAEEHQIKLLLDAAHAFGCTHQGRLLGGFGNAEIFSFHATKVINAAEGGVVVTNDDNLAEILRAARTFHDVDVCPTDLKRMNAKMSEAQAAMALLSLGNFVCYAELNKQRYEMYADCLSGLPGIHFVDYARDEKSNYQYVVLDVNERISGISRDELLRELEAENVLARKYFSPPVHQADPYCSQNSFADECFPVTIDLANSLFQLPTGQAISLDDVKNICALLKKIILK